MRTKRLIVATFIAFFLQALNYAITVAADRPNASSIYDVVITNGKIVDGSGNPWFYADVAIKNGKIAKVGKVDSRMGKRVIDAKGMVVSPGFIDLHTHTDMPVLADGNVESAVRQGVTLDVIGESSTVAPLKGGCTRRVQRRGKTASRSRSRLDDPRRLFSSPQ